MQIPGSQRCSGLLCVQPADCLLRPTGPLIHDPASPSTPLCERRQLGIRLHELGEQLPLLDTATGLPVPADLDAAVEK